MLFVGCFRHIWLRFVSDKTNHDGQPNKPRPSVKNYAKNQETEARCTEGISRYVRDSGSEVKGSQGFAVPLGPKDSTQDTSRTAPSKESKEASCTETIQCREKGNVKRKLKGLVLQLISLSWLSYIVHPLVSML